MDSYIFPAILDPDEGPGYTVTFPDLPGCITEGGTLEEALTMATEALELHLFGMEEDGDPIPQPSPTSEIEVPPGAFVSLIRAWMPRIRDSISNRAVKKTLTLPKWLNDLAESRHINFSQVLQSALKNTLGVSDMHKR